MTEKNGSPPCGIYVRVENYSDMPETITGLRQMALVINRASGYEKNMHVVEFVYDSARREEIADLCAVTQAEGLVAILSGIVPEDEADLCGADGVMLDDPAVCGDVRKLLGEDAIVGLVCGGDRALAEAALALDVDYVSLAPDEGLVHWWRMKTDTLCLVAGALTNETCGAFARAGATFIDAGGYIFGHDKGVMQGTVNMLHALDLALGVPERVN